MVFPSTSGVSVRVLRPMFVPGCGGPHEFVNSVRLSHFVSAVIPLSPRSVSHLLSPWSIVPVSSSCSRFFSSFPSTSPLDLLPCLFILPFLFLPSSSSSLFLPPSLFSRSPLCLEGPMGALWFVCWKAYQHHRRHRWNLSLFSLFTLFPAQLLFSSPSLLSLFSSSLFNVEVLSNCWLLLWLGGNGIFRRMPHAVALTHSSAPPSPSLSLTHTHTHNTRTLKHVNLGGYSQWIYNTLKQKVMGGSTNWFFYFCVHSYKDVTSWTKMWNRFSHPYTFYHQWWFRPKSRAYAVSVNNVSVLTFSGYMCSQVINQTFFTWC